ncbi:hypothetical protein [Rhodococcoides yunnanense]|uniref:hypothetical protein n=1 Tax=Rhodococcoides yunnanense TaxID=278209 RepID=UPI00093246B8|nr:hypothetical protein [Rhodococcus yunnanensis]
MTAPIGSQPGITSVPETPTPPAAPAPAPTYERDYLPGYTPPASQENAQWRSYDSYDDGAYSTVEPETAPEPSNESTDVVPENDEPLPASPGPIQAPDNKIRLGSIITDIPGWLPPQTAEEINNTGASLENQGAVFFNDLGIPTTRADRIAAGSTAGFVVGFTVAAGVTYATVAPLAALGGGVIGGVAGGLAGTPLGTVLVPIPGVGTVSGTVAGSVVGAAAGAAGGAAAALPVAAGVGTVVGAVTAFLGGVAGSGEGVGELPPPLPVAPAPDPAQAPPASGDLDAITLNVQHGLDQVAALPEVAQAVESVQVAVQDAPLWIEPARHAVEQFSTTVLEQPAVEEVQNAVAPAVDQARAALDLVLPAPAPA